MAGGERGDARLLRDLAALGRLTSRDGGSARARLEAQLGAERVSLLVGALGRSPGRGATHVRPAASA
ncbi:MAG: hypothetical protein IT201_09140 [Thermoleophilia bacterium]|nr:hypothetical protein [Thermoleophilia bacterium]